MNRETKTTFLGKENSSFSQSHESRITQRGSRIDILHISPEKANPSQSSVLVLGGFGTNAKSYLPFLHELSQQGYDVLAPSFSPRIPRMRSTFERKKGNKEFQDEAQAVAHFLEEYAGSHASQKTIDIVAHSHGAQMALEVVRILRVNNSLQSNKGNLVSPRIRKIIFVAPEGMRDREHLSRLGFRSLHNGFTEIQRAFFGKKKKYTTEEKRNLLRVLREELKVVKHMPWVLRQSFFASHNRSENQQSIQALKDEGIDTHILYGQDDQLYPHDYKGNIKGISSTVIPHATHNALMIRPKLFMPIIHELLSPTNHPLAKH